METELDRQYLGVRRELHGYLCRLVVRPQIAEELAQTTYLRCLEAADRLPESAEGVRAWLFRVATNLALDELRRHAGWRETAMDELRTAANASPAFIALSREKIGTPETRHIAREHLVACLACVLRQLPGPKAAALLLREVHGFSLAEVADILDAGAHQVKNWLQEGRSHMQRHYGSRCALIAKAGVCHQCDELSGWFQGEAPAQLAGLRPPQSIDQRLGIAARHREQEWGPWHRIMWDLIDELG